MPALEVPRAMLNKAAGWMLLKPTEDGLHVYIREDKANIGLYPRPCSVDLRLPSWDMPPVIVVALLVNVARRERLTFQTWINAGSLPGTRILTNLSNERRIHVHIVTDRIERSIRTPNVMKRQAKELLRRISSETDRWNEEEVEQAQKQIHTLYPSSWKMWQALCRDQRG